METLNNKNLQKLVGHFKESGFEIRIVGGAVRDFLAGVECKDIDFCTNATPDEMIELAEKFNLHLVPTGLQHGTVTFVIAGEPFEVTTLRIDTDTDGRHATVEFTRDFRLDAERRDLTINAMSMDPITGEVFDYFGGREDLHYGEVKFVGDAKARIREDFLRVLRWFRFATRFGQKFDSETVKIFSEDWVHEGLSKISGERIWAETKKILEHPNGAETIKAMIETGVANSWFCDNSKFNANSGNFVLLTRIWDLHNDLISRNPNGYTRVKSALMMAKLAMVTINQDPKAVIDRLKFSVDERRDFEEYHNVMKFHAGMSYFNNYSAVSSYYFDTANGAEPSSAVVSLYLGMLFTSSVTFVIETYLTPDGKVQFMHDMVPFTVTGADLIAIGMKPGPAMGHVLRAMKHMWAFSDPRCTISKEELLSNFQNMFPDMSQIHPLKFEMFNVSKAIANKETMFDESEQAYAKALNVMLTVKAADQTTIGVTIDPGPQRNQELLLFFKDKQSAMIARLENIIDV